MDQFFQFNNHKTGHFSQFFYFVYPDGQSLCQYSSLAD
jgi:hypothetical protein